MEYKTNITEKELNMPNAPKNMHELYVTEWQVNNTIQTQNKMPDLNIPKEAYFSQSRTEIQKPVRETVEKHYTENKTYILE